MNSSIHFPSRLLSHYSANRTDSVAKNRSQRRGKRRQWSRSIDDLVPYLTLLHVINFSPGCDKNEKVSHLTVERPEKGIRIESCKSNYQIHDALRWKILVIITLLFHIIQARIQTRPLTELYFHSFSLLIHTFGIVPFDKGAKTGAQITVYCQKRV